MRLKGERRAESPNASSAQFIESNDMTYNTHRIREWIQESGKLRFGHRNSQVHISTSTNQVAEQLTVERLRDNVKSQITCFACGQAGHCATDPKCPKYNPSQKKQLYDDEEILDNNELKNDGETSDESKTVSTSIESMDLSLIRTKKYSYE
jgi:hypothetical protein